MCVYQKVRSYIVDHEIDPESVADKIGKPVATLNAMLDGTQTLYADDLREICYALNVSPEEFIIIAKGEKL